MLKKLPLLRKKALYLWRWSLSLLAGGHTAGYARWLSFGANNHLSSFRLSGNYLALAGLAKPKALPVVVYLSGIVSIMPPVVNAPSIMNMAPFT